MSLLRLSAARVRVFSFVGVSLTSLSVTISKNGGAFAAVHGAGLANITGNFYSVTLDSTDTNTLGDLAYKFSDTVIGVTSPNGDDVDQVLTALPGNSDMLVTLADGVDHGGTMGSSTATLALANVNVTGNGATPSLNIVNAGNGSAVSMSGSSGNQPAVVLSGGNGDAAALQLQSNSTTSATVVVFGGQNSPAVQYYGPFVGSGPVIVVDNKTASTGGTGGDGVLVRVDAGNALLVTTASGGDALHLEAAGGGQGMQTKGANGISAISTGGGGSGIFAQGDVTAPGIDALGGSTSGPGLRARAGTGSTFAGAHFLGDGTGEGCRFEGGTDGDGVDLIGHGANSPGVRVMTTSSDALTVNNTTSVDLTGRHRLLSGLTTNQQLANFEFTMTDTSGVPTPGLSVVATRSIDGGAYAACANAVAGVGNGRYKITLAATDLNGSVIGVRFTAVGAADLNLTLLTSP